MNIAKENTMRLILFTHVHGSEFILFVVCTVLRKTCDVQHVMQQNCLNEKKKKFLLPICFVILRGNDGFMRKCLRIKLLIFFILCYLRNQLIECCTRNNMEINSNKLRTIFEILETVRNYASKNRHVHFVI